MQKRVCSHEDTNAVVVLTRDYRDAFVLTVQLTEVLLSFDERYKRGERMLADWSPDYRPEFRCCAL